MTVFGPVEVEGATSYVAAKVRLRAPRVAVRVDASVHWQSQFALAMSAASTLWGGAGFIFIPVDSGAMHPAFGPVLRAYDPDYLIDFELCMGELEALEPGWLRRHMQDAPTDASEYEALVKNSSDQPVPTMAHDDVGADFCTPYDDPNDPHADASRPMHVLSSGNHHYPLTKLTELGTAAVPSFEIADGLDPLLALALGLRAGFSRKPTLPLGTPTQTDDDPELRLPSNHVHYALLHDVDRGSGVSELEGAATAWQLSQAGLVHLQHIGRDPAPTAVIGSTANDFALALALDRMFGRTIWFPDEWLADSWLKWQVSRAFDRLTDLARRSSPSEVVVTSTSHSAAELLASVEPHWPQPVTVTRSGQETTPETIRSSPPTFRQPANLMGQPAQFLAIADSYNHTASLPTRADGKGGFEFLLDLPPYVPTQLVPASQRPFWEVDLDIYPATAPAGRGIAGATSLADPERFPKTVVRSSRDGLSFNPVDLGFISAGANLVQSVATPRLRIIGLRSWIEQMISQRDHQASVELSEAGRRAAILTRLWGSRSALAEDLFNLRPFLTDFEPNDRSRAKAYPAGDGYPLNPSEAVLTVAAAQRSLKPSMSDGQIRDRLNDLLSINVLQRGAIIPCQDCGKWAFYRADILRETNTCGRCGADAHLTAAWRDNNDEPQWFYDLHGAVREILDQNGDVPLLAARALRAKARSYFDVAELDIISGEGKRSEIDLIALVGEKLLVGEAKIKAEVGPQKLTSTIEKLLRVADVLGADEVALCTAATGPWKESEITKMLAAMARFHWRFGEPPQLRIMTNLRTATPNSQLVPPS